MLAAVESLHPAIELPDSRFRHFERAGLAQLVADNACAHRFVLGPATTADWRALDLANHRGRMLRNGVVAEDGIGSNVLGDPRIALTWLANELSAPWRNAESGPGRHHRHLRQAGADRPGRPL